MRKPPFQAVALDSIPNAEAVARALGQQPQFVLGGLVLFWVWCRRNRTDLVGEAHLRGFFPGVDGRQLIEQLVAQRFLERSRDGLRVLGAEDWLGIPSTRAEAGALGGKKTAESGKSLGNLLRGPPKQHPKQKYSESEANPEASSCIQPAASSQQPAASAPQAAPQPATPPAPKVRKPSASEAFREWARGERERVHPGLVSEAPDKPAKLNSTVGPILGEVGTNGAQRAYLGYLADAKWRDKSPGWPFALFCAGNVWRGYMTQPPREQEKKPLNAEERKALYAV